jgi:endonuclease/exonuclease/phosphatase family metal-dependent hydrolase
MAKVYTGIMLLLTLGAMAAAGLPARCQDLRVMSFNIRYGTANDGDNHWEKRREMVFDLLRSQQSDVIGLQEALRFQLDELLKALPEYAALGVGRDDGKSAGEHSAILYRKSRFSVEESGTFWLSNTPEVPGSKSWGNRITRICTWARLTDRMTGRALYVYNVHLDHESQPSRERSVRLLLERMRARPKAEPILLLGDLNAGEENPATRFLTSQLDFPLVDTFRVRRSDAAEVGTFHAFRGVTSGAKIDYVFASLDFYVLDAQIVRENRRGRYPSDHFPVTARLRWKQTDAPPPDALSGLRGTP